MILSGIVIAQRIEEQIAARVSTLPFQPRLAIILVGTDPASVLYDQRKQTAAQRVGIACELIHLEQATTEQLVALIESLNTRTDVDGILIQLPLPDAIDTDRVVASLDPTKDVDGFHPQSTATPPLVQAVLWLLEETGAILAGLHAVIVGKSDIFLQPLTRALEERGMGVTWVRPPQLPSPETKRADVLISAAGNLFCITPDDIKPNAIIIDIGINRTPEGKVRGDVHPDCAAHAAFMTPTPGGVGPVTIAAALYHVVELALRRRI